MNSNNQLKMFKILRTDEPLRGATRSLISHHPQLRLESTIICVQKRQRYENKCKKPKS